MRSIAIAVFVIVAASYAAMAYKPTNPQFPLLAFASLGIGAIAAWITLKTGNLVTHPRTHEELRFWARPERYTRWTAALWMQLAIITAAGILFILHTIVAFDRGSWLSAATAIMLFAFVAYPYVRHRIERGYWPD